MTEITKKHYDLLKSKEYRSARHEPDLNVTDAVEGMSAFEKESYCLHFMLSSETPYLIEDDIFGFNRTVKGYPYVMLDGQKKRSPRAGNVTPHYGKALSCGMDEICRRIKEKMATCEESQLAFYGSALSCVESSLDFADRYREYARERGAQRLYRALCRVPRQGATSFYEACVFMKFIIFTLRCNRSDHITLGGFDKYMYPYFKADLDRGVSENELFDILEDFFISLNFDTDLYFGVQQGDNGQSMVLGGRDAEGNDRFNLLSQMCLDASKELCIIDPKINLRVDKNTPLSRLESATELTKKGLGFPQYCNDDIVIPGLEKLGYSHADACNYTVAACWECISEGNGGDFPNISKMNFPKAVEKAVNTYLAECADFDTFLERVKACITEECKSVADRVCALHLMPPSPYLSAFVDDCIERGLDISEGGAKYNNFGIHGVGIANAADAIAAVRRTVFEEKRYTANQLLTAIKADFEGYNELRNYLLSCPKMGNNDDYVDQYADLCMDIFANVLRGKTNSYGGRIRPGTGSAMEYIKSAAEVGATADGRHAKAPFPSSFSPSVTAKLSGPLSCIQSFTKHDMTEVINGGPLTMEIHDNTFRNADGVRKVAALVKVFIDLGGHQLQLNAINREVLLDAQKHPEDHQNLIVRVWGWSGYFNELHVDYQNHIISRVEFLA